MDTRTPDTTTPAPFTNARWHATADLYVRLATALGGNRWIFDTDIAEELLATSDDDRAALARFADRCQAVRAARVYTTQDAADRLQLTPTAVARLARTGKLPGRMVGNRWLFTAAALERYIEKHSGASHEQ